MSSKNLMITADQLVSQEDWELICKDALTAVTVYRTTIRGMNSKIIEQEKLIKKLEKKLKDSEKRWNEVQIAQPVIDASKIPFPTGGRKKRRRRKKTKKRKSKRRRRRKTKRN